MEHLPLGTVNSLPTIDPTVYTVYTIFKPRFPTETALMATCIPENCSWAPLYGAEVFSSQLQQVLPSFPKGYQRPGLKLGEARGAARERERTIQCEAPKWLWVQPHLEVAFFLPTLSRVRSMLQCKIYCDLHGAR